VGIRNGTVSTSPKQTNWKSRQLWDYKGINPS